MVSRGDRHRMERLQAALREVETDEQPSSEAWQRLVRAANAWRADHGIRPLREDREDPPELALYRRARALGRGRRRG